MDPFKYPIEMIVPHSHPMILIDELIAISETSASSKLVLREDSLLLDDSGHVSASIGIEWMAQTIAAHAGYQAREEGRPVEVGFLLGTRRYNSQRALFASGEMFTVTVEQLYLESGMASYACQVKQNNQIVIEATLNTYQPSKEQISTVIGEKSE